MNIQKGVPVDQYLAGEEIRKGPSEVRMCIVRALSSHDDRAEHAALDLVKQAVRHKIHQLESFDITLDQFDIKAHASDDPNNRAFDPSDQIATVMDGMLNANLLLIGCRVSHGFPDAALVRVIERMDGYMATNHAEPSREPRRVAVVSFGDSDSNLVAGEVALVFLHLGYGITAHGAVNVDVKKEKPAAYQSSLQRVAEHLTTVVSSLNR